MTQHTPIVGASLATLLTDTTAPWWLPLVVQGISLLIAYLNGRQQGKRKAAKANAVHAEATRKAEPTPDTSK